MMTSQSRARLDLDMSRSGDFSRMEISPEKDMIRTGHIFIRKNVLTIVSITCDSPVSEGEGMT